MWYPLVRRLLFQLEAEKSHDLSLRLLKLVSPHGLLRRRLAHFPQHPVKVLGLTFPNPVGLAAGFDKNGDYLEPLLGLGFGFIEAGTVTPKPQLGNPKPRLFRLPAVSGLVNRMGFNNRGVDYLVEKLRQRRLPGIVGVNIGKNLQTPLENAVDDYCCCLRTVYSWADYITVNISSPNTPGLRQLQSSAYLNNLLTGLDRTQLELLEQVQRKVPLLIKIDPDLNDAELAALVETILHHRVDGLIATNTTLNHSYERGGLSGKPIFQRSTEVVQILSQLLAGKLPIIAVGGIFSAEDALAKLSAGASLVQIYTGLIYQGPNLVRNIISKFTGHSTQVKVIPSPPQEEG